mmetsp:Transcript_129372/g.242055  ORF Transcript_129372/g.242055 Transcript_129372/m.242055 type:complete len:640 (-) Transcript_129372:31-1950(-)
MEQDPGNRFEHLLKPIRDLSTVWNIDVAESLEKYCEEVSRLRVTNQVDGRKGVNFAEAALVIQGSTAIYSQKVEMLYKLVYEALELIASDKAKEEQRKRNRTYQPGGLWAPIPETEALLTVDHLLKDGRNIMFDDSFHQGERKFVQRRLPLFLMPREKAERRRQEFRISSCTVHSSGAYLLQESDSKLLDNLLLKDDGISQYDDEPLAPPPPSEVADLDKQLQELRRDLPPPQADLFAALDETKEAMDAIVRHEGQQQQDALGIPQAGGSLPPFPAPAVNCATQPPEDPWWCYDVDEPGGQELKLEVGRCGKPLDKKKLRASMQNYGEAGTWGALPEAADEDEAMWDGEAAKSFGDGSRIDHLFLEIASRAKQGSRFVTHKICFSNALLEFEDLVIEAAKVRQKKQTHSKKPRTSCSGGVDLGVAPDCNSDEEIQEPFASPRSQGPVDLDDYGLRDEEYRQEVERIETLIRERQEQYNDTIRDKLLQQDGGALLETDDKRFPELWANVQRWTEQLVPVLKEHESRPEFNIDVYGTKLLNKLSGIKEDQEDHSKPIPFPRLVHGQPRWEIGRRFLTCLQLTNQGNTDITYKREEERQNKFGLQLLKMEKETLSLEMQEEAPAPLPPPAKRLRRMSREAGG